MKTIFSERNIVAILFVLVFITFSLAQEDSRKMEKMYSGINAAAASHLLVLQPELKVQGAVSTGHASIPEE